MGDSITNIQAYIETHCMCTCRESCGVSHCAVVMAVCHGRAHRSQTTVYVCDTSPIASPANITLQADERDSGLLPGTGLWV